MSDTLRLVPGRDGSLIVSRVRRPEWVERAACRGADCRLFYPNDTAPAAYAEAKAICSACSVRSDCLEAAVSAMEEFGCWAGTTPSERRVTLGACIVHGVGG
jgi:WhiB family redox-sensing transcriptional regulator